MVEPGTERLSQAIIAKAKALGADLAGIVRLEDLKRSPSHAISEKMVEFHGVGTKSVAGRKRGIVRWPEGARCAVVIALAHPAQQPELDWWVTGSFSGNTAGNQQLMATIKRLADWLERAMGILSFKLPYHIEHGAVYMKDTAVLAGLGCIGKNNLLITPQHGPRQRLRVMLIDSELPSTGPIAYDPCRNCPMPCRRACPRHAFSQKIYTQAEYGTDTLPGRSGVYSRLQCNRQMEIDIANAEAIEIEGQAVMGRRVAYCRECELTCPVGTD